MPDRLRNVEQRVGMDASGYHSEAREVVADNIAMGDSADDLTRKIGELTARLGELSRMAGSLDSREITITTRYVTVGHPPPDLGDVTRTVYTRYVNSGDPGRGGGFGADPMVLRELRDSSASLDMLTSTMGRVEEHMAAMRRDVADSSADLMMQTQIARDNAAVIVAASRRGGGGGAALAAAAGAAGGGGGGGGGAAAGAAAGGLAGRIFGGALPTLQVAHMATMLTMEIASQVIPAMVAAGAAAAVGWQGGVAAYQRGQGIYNAGEALGGAYGVTPGNLFGMGAGYQVAQNQATGGVYGIFGSLMRMAGQGTGQGGILGPGGMGVQTVAMIDRGLANMVGSGRMAQLSQALGGGTGALRTIGDIGANLGDTMLNLAPNLPGMGGLLFGGLKGITGAASWLTGNIPGPLIGAGLAAEAGWRWGKPILAGGKLPGWLGGAKFGGMAGLAERLGLGTVADAGAGVEGAGLAGALGAAGGPGTAGLALAAWLVSQAFTPGAQRGLPQQMGMAQAGINASFGAGSLHPITSALYQVSAAQQASAAGTGPVVTDPTLRALVHAGAMTPAQAAARQQQELGGYAQQFATQLGQMTAAGPSVVQALSGLGVKGATLGQAFDYMTMAMISPKDVGPGGKLDKTAASQLASFVKTYSLMGSGGQTSASAILSASNADYVMASPQMKSLSQINSALDSVTQVMTGGAANASALTGLVQGIQTSYAPAPGVRGAPTATSAFARALGQGPFTTAGAAAWQAFTNPQTGIMAASQANMDQLRTFMTIGGLSGTQAGQLGAFELKQYTPYASQSPMALAMLQQQAMQAGVPGVAMGQSYAQTQKAINAHAGTAQQASRLLTQGTQAAANIPGVADFLNPSANISPLQSALYAQMAQSAITAAQHPTKGNISALQSSLSMSGVKPGQMTVAVDAILKNLHVPPNLVAQVNAQMKPPKVPPVHGVVNFDNHLKAPPHQRGTGTIDYANKVPSPPHPVGYGTIIYSNVVSGVIGKIGGHTGQHGLFVPDRGSFGDVNPALLERGEVVVPRNMVQAGEVNHLRGRIPGFQAGGGYGISVPYYASMGVDFRAAMTSVAQQLFTDMQQAVASLGSRTVPIGGGGGTSGAALAAAQGSANLQSLISMVRAASWDSVGVTIVRGVSNGIKDTPAETAKIAKGIAAQVKAEVAYASGVAQAAAQGQGYGQAGLLGTFTAPAPGSQLNLRPAAPGTRGYSPAAWNAYVQAYASDSLPGGTNAAAPAQTVQQQMQSYLGSLRSFTKDLSALHKDHLSKGLLSQLVAAGPVQGDALARSIMGGKGGVQAANSLWASIGKASHGLGIMAANLMYGGHPSTTSLGGQFAGAGGTIVNISIGGGVSSDLQLSAKQLNQLVKEVQQALLKQGKKNRRTGVQLAGYGA